MNVTKMYVTDEDLDALAWVREHGGLDAVRTEWRSRVPYDRYERRRQNLLRHIAECETALGRRNRRIEELGHRVSDLTTENSELRRRAMPKGCEWPRFEDNDPLEFGDKFVERGGVVNVVASVEICADRFEVYGFDGASSQYSKGERVKRPSFLAADGEPLEVGQTVWFKTSGREMRVDKIEHRPESIWPEGFWALELFADGSKKNAAPVGVLTHKRPVLDADGVPICEGDTVWRLTDGKKHEVTGINPQFGDIRVKDESMELGVWDSADGFTHTKPEIDTWQRIEEDAGCTATKYNERRGTIFTTKQQVARDLVRRCRSLAERERGE